MNLPVSSRAVPTQRVRPARADDWLVGQLPIGMQEDDFLLRFVRIFQDVANGLLIHADALPHLADLTVTTPEMVRWLGHWIGNDSIDERMDVVLQRALVDVFGASVQWRGTRRGLRELLVLLAGPDVEIEDNGGFRTGDDVDETGGHVVVRAPASPFVGAADIASLARAEVPASVNLTVYVDGEVVHDDRREIEES